MKKDKKSLLLLYEFESVFAELESDEERSSLIMAIFAYERRGEEPEFSGTLRYAWRTHIKPKLDELRDSYAQKCNSLRENANKRWNIHPNTKETSNMQMNANAQSNMQMNANAQSNMQMNANASYKEKEKEKEKKKEKLSLLNTDSNNNIPTRELTDCDVRVDDARESPPDSVLHSVGTEETKEAIQHFQNAICPIRNHAEMERIRMLIHDYGLPAFIRAVDISKARGGQSLQYVATVLRSPRPPGQRVDRDVGLTEEAIRSVLE